MIGLARGASARASHAPAAWMKQAGTVSSRWCAQCSIDSQNSGVLCIVNAFRADQQDLRISGVPAARVSRDPIVVASLCP